MRNILFLFAAIGCDNTVKQINIEPSADIIIVTDLDGDAYSEEEDCDDNSADTYPGALETCDGLDNDCNDIIDDNEIYLFAPENYLGNFFLLQDAGELLLVVFVLE